jgi:solute carrier family 35 protein E1
MNKELTTRTARLAMGSNIAFSLRSILRKNNLSAAFKQRTHLDASNEHAITTLLSFLLTLPFALSFERPDAVLSALSRFRGKEFQGFLTNLFLCGMSFYLYNDMQNNVLGSLGPVPTAVGNTLKRVVIFVAL